MSEAPSRQPLHRRELQAAAAWQELVNGNARFVAGEPLHPGQDAARRAELNAAQRPFALIFGCGDSRVAAEIVFDQGLGDLFVIRTAGHVVDAGVLGSVEFGLQVLGIPLIVVLGHDRCGAVAAAVETIRSGTSPPGYIRDIAERIMPSALKVLRAQPANGKADSDAPPIDSIEAEHVRQTARLLVEKSRILETAVAAGRCAVIGATYQLAQGKVRIVTRGVPAG